MTHLTAVPDYDEGLDRLHHRIARALGLVPAPAGFRVTGSANLYRLSHERVGTLYLTGDSTSEAVAKFRELTGAVGFVGARCEG